MTQHTAIPEAQHPLPGIEPGGRFVQPPLLAVVGAGAAHTHISVDEEITTEGRPPAVSLDQLTLGPNQMVLEESPPGPIQLGLLPDPPAWEADPPTPPTPHASGRLARRRRRANITPGQTSLF